jgi:hypothetical protein
VTDTSTRWRRGRGGGRCPPRLVLLVQLSSFYPILSISLSLQLLIAAMDSRQSRRGEFDQAALDVRRYRGHHGGDRRGGRMGMARTDGYFSGPRDCMTGRSTVFASTMIALLARLLDETPHLPNPFRGHDVAGTMLRQHWMGEYFRDSLCRDQPSGDGNVWPFFFDVVVDPDLRRRAVATLEDRGFTKPIPLRYFETRLRESELPVPRAITPNYQGDPSWTQLGPAYLHVLKSVNRPLMEQHRTTMATLIERDRNYLEVYTTDGKPYRGRAFLYQADEGMIWASMFLDLYR